LSEVIDETLTPGDFVRHMRQCIDLLRQMAQAGDSDIARACESASDLLDRGVVAAATAVI
jgi:superfamily II RNA helicase